MLWVPACHSSRRKWVLGQVMSVCLTQSPMKAETARNIDPKQQQRHDKSLEKVTGGRGSATHQLGGDR